MNSERTNFKRAFIIQAILFSLFLLGLAAHFFEYIPAQYELVVLGLIGAVGMIPVAKSAWESLRDRKVNVDLLATIALFFSFAAHEWTSMLFINLMLTSARVMDLYTKRRARISLESLLNLKPQNARVVNGNDTALVPLANVRVGDLVEVNLGEQIPVDGVVVKGGATVDQSSLTGESLPVLKTVNDAVLSATVVSSGNIVVRADKVGTETTFERMIELVESAQNEKTHMKTIAERFASWYIGIMLLVSIVLFVVTKDMTLVLSVVLVVCADEIAIAIPLAYVTSIGTAARRGIIVKGADFLEGFAKITTLIVDKTGTVTEGKLAVKNVYHFGSISSDKMLMLAGTICQGSTHPVSRAIADYVERHNIHKTDTDHFEEKEGLGIAGIIEGKSLVIGRIEFISERGITPTKEVQSVLLEETAKANNVTLLSYGEEIVGVFGLADELRPDIRSTIATLKKRGVTETVMLTGDNETVAASVAKYAGIDKYFARLLPENKVSILEKYLLPGKTVAMVGDGVNDAAVLSRADIGIAMGGIGSDAAIESADIVLMKDNFEKIIELRDISDAAMSVVRENFIIWGLVNAVGLYLVFTGVFDPAKAAAYNFLTDFVPIFNSLRLYYYHGTKRRHRTR